MYKSIYLILVLIIISGCKNRSDTISNEYLLLPRERKVPVKYASGFDIGYYSKFTLLTVRNPWQKADDVEFKYALINRTDSTELKPEGYKIIRIPVRRAVCLSTTHIGFIDFLGIKESIVGISGEKYITDNFIINRIKSGEVKDIGYDESLNYELILELKPDIIFVYGVTGAISSYINKLEELNISTVLVGEYLEETPLAKMEWIKFMAAFYEMENKALTMFDSVSNKYNCLVSLTENISVKPKVLLGLPWRGAWYISGSNSYVARLIKDAGGDYLWSNLNFRDSQPLSLESVFEKAFLADFWLNTGSVNNISDIIKVDERFGELPSLKNEKVFNNNNKTNNYGGNAYYSTGVVEPDIVLSDIIYILHPEILPDHNLKYYKQMN
ncbi:MAG: ABC transporter substrate-binding protein [Bacteroidales bacterium]|nr:MAG: ABC transporter substrate-binding protein [Bacteroidales bacterium]